MASGLNKIRHMNAAFCFKSRNMIIYRQKQSYFCFIVHGFFNNNQQQYSIIEHQKDFFGGRL